MSKYVSQKTRLSENIPCISNDGYENPTQIRDKKTNLCKPKKLKRTVTTTSYLNPETGTYESSRTKKGRYLKNIPVEKVVGMLTEKQQSEIRDNRREHAMKLDGREPINNKPSKKKVTKKDDLSIPHVNMDSLNISDLDDDDNIDNFVDDEDLDDDDNIDNFVGDEDLDDSIDKPMSDNIDDLFSGKSSDKKVRFEIDSNEYMKISEKLDRILSILGDIQKERVSEESVKQVETNMEQGFKPVVIENNNFGTSSSEDNNESENSIFIKNNNK